MFILPSILGADRLHLKQLGAPSLKIKKLFTSISRKKTAAFDIPASKYVISAFLQPTAAVGHFNDQG